MTSENGDECLEGRQYCYQTRNGKEKVTSKYEMSVMRGEINELEKRDFPITIRVILRDLEDWICFNASGSKAQYRLYYHNFDKIYQSNNTELKINLANELSKYNLTDSHIKVLKSLKEGKYFILKLYLFFRHTII